MSGSVSVYVTLPDLEQARAMAYALVEAKLVACANMVEASSVYRYGPQIVNEREVVMFLKTTREALDALVAEIGRLHPYDVPCIVALDIVGGYAPYLDWIRGQVRSAP